MGSMGFAGGFLDWYSCWCWCSSNKLVYVYG